MANRKVVQLANEVATVYGQIGDILAKSGVPELKKKEKALKAELLKLMEQANLKNITNAGPKKYTVTRYGRKKAPKPDAECMERFLGLYQQSYKTSKIDPDKIAQAWAEFLKKESTDQHTICVRPRSEKKAGGASKRVVPAETVDGVGLVPNQKRRKLVISEDGEEGRVDEDGGEDEAEPEGDAEEGRLAEFDGP